MHHFALFSDQNKTSFLDQKSAAYCEPISTERVIEESTAAVMELWHAVEFNQIKNRIYAPVVPNSRVHSSVISAETVF